MKPLGAQANPTVERSNPSPTATPTPSTLMLSAIAAPNVSRGGENIRLLLNLRNPAHVTLSVFTVTGERVFGHQQEGSQGPNTLTWDAKNTTGGRAASGLYLYVLTADDGVNRETRTGKIVIIK